MLALASTYLRRPSRSGCATGRIIEAESALRPEAASV